MPAYHHARPLALFASLSLALSSASAVELIFDFTYDIGSNGDTTNNIRTAAWDAEPNVFSNTLTNPADYNNSTKWTQAASSIPAPYTFHYNISSLGIGPAHEVRITVDTVSSTAALNPASGNGIAVVGGTSNVWWDPSDPSLSFNISVRDVSNNDITANLNIDLTGVAMRWGAETSATFAGESISRTTTLQGVNLATGQTSETSFTATRTGVSDFTQIQQLRFNITAGPDESPPAITTLTPADNATSVSVSSNLIAVFNEPIALTGTGSITLRDQGPGPDIVISLPNPQVTITGDNTLVINPDSNLLPNNGYSILISADAIVDLADPPNAFAGISNDATWDFSTSGPPPTGPNVIVFLVDDLGLTDVQQHPTYFPDGSPLYETPNIHRLASEGMLFRNAYTQPLCSASRSCLLSGQHTPARDALYLAIVGGSTANPTLPATSATIFPYNYPTDRNHMPLAVETIAERMKAAGYATWHAGKWHLSPASPADPSFYPIQQGFDKQLSVGGSGPPSYFGPFSNIPNMVDHLGNPDVGTVRDHISEHMGKLVRNLIDHHLATDPDRPFFLYYPTYSVHAPHEARKSLFNYYQTKLNGLPDSKHTHPVMAAQVHMSDLELGSMLDFLDDRNLDENTLFIFLSDNGGLSNERSSASLFDDIGSDGIPDHLPGNTVNGNYAKTTSPLPSTTRMTNMAPRKAGKGSLFDGGLRIPMIIRYPNGNIPANTQTAEAVHLTDIYPTILDYTPAIPKPGYTLDGTSLQPVLNETGPLPERSLYIYFPRSNETWGAGFTAQGYPGTEDEPFDIYPGGTAVINYPFKMIARYSTAHDAATVDYQLFNIELDVGELNNIAGLYPEVVDAMRKQMDAFHLATNAFVPTKNPNYNGTSRNLPETTAQAYLTAAGLTPGTPQSFLLADPDGDDRRNENEFLEQTDPDSADNTVATSWLYDNGSFLEPRFALPANVIQSSFHILDADDNVAFSPSFNLTLDGQYGPFYVYRPTQPVPATSPAAHLATLRPTLVRPTPAPSAPPILAQDDFPHLSINSHTNSISFNLRDQIGYRIYKSENLTDWTIWEDFGIISGNHDANLPLNPRRDREFYKIEVYQP